MDNVAKKNSVDKRIQLGVGIIQMKDMTVTLILLPLCESASFTSEAAYKVEKAQTITRGEPLAVMPMVDPYLYTLDCSILVQML